MGVLSGVRVLEFEAIGPGPFAAMLLADMGAEVIRVDRPVAPEALTPRAGHKPLPDITGRGRSSVTLDLKNNPAAAEAALALMARADIVIEGFRPGTMERLGLGPDAAFKRNPKLVYGRMTGWGQTGPLAQSAGHDLNYIALSGLLSTIGAPGGKPVPPLNLVGDYGGGAMLLAMGVLAAHIEVLRGGKGQVVDAAMAEGAAQLGSIVWGMLAGGLWREQRGSNFLDGGAPWYDCYETADGGYMAVGAVEARFYAEMIEKLGLTGAALPGQHERKRWPELRAALAAAFKRRTRAEWSAVFEGSDACVAPVLGLAEAPEHAHAQARGSFVEIDGVRQPVPAPRFLGSPSALPRLAPARGQHGAQALTDWGFDGEAVARLRAQGLGAD
jgi:alpha-methylacyl-CoA racemase